jgi:hypothetical protein
LCEGLGMSMQKWCVWEGVVIYCMQEKLAKNAFVGPRTLCGGPRMVNPDHQIL